MAPGELNAEGVLWSHFIEGDKSAFSKLYKAHASQLYQYGLKLTSNVELIKDNIQELFIELWQTRETKQQVVHVKTYLLSALRYKILKSLKKTPHAPIDDHQVVHQTHSRETEIILAEIDAHKTYELRKLISKLPQRHREIIHLKYYQGLDAEQMAQILSINKQSVANLLHRALSGLRGRVEKKVLAK